MTCHALYAVCSFGSTPPAYVISQRTTFHVTRWRQSSSTAVSSSVTNFVLVILRSWFAQTFLEDALISRLRCTGPEIRKGSVFCGIRVRLGFGGQAGSTFWFSAVVGLPRRPLPLQGSVPGRAARFLIAAHTKSIVRGT